MLWKSNVPWSQLACFPTDIGPKLLSIVPGGGHPIVDTDMRGAMPLQEQFFMNNISLVCFHKQFEFVIADAS